MAIELERIGWENGTLVSPAKVNIQGTVYDVEPEIYSGNTPLSAELLKEMEDNTENAINEGILQPNTFSTEETRIGTWIDGKPLYRKVYTATDSSGFNNDINVPIGFTTWDEVVTLRGIITTKSNEIFPLPSINYSGTNIYGRQIEIISKTGSWQPNTFYIVNRNTSTDDDKTKKYVIVFEYTKTTD